MTFETTTALAPEDVVARAKTFFATRIPATSAFLETESAHHVVLRGQGGEEVVIACAVGEGGTRVRGSSLLFSQQVKRFFSTLSPCDAAVAAL